MTDSKDRYPRLLAKAIPKGLQHFMSPDDPDLQIAVRERLQTLGHEGTVSDKAIIDAGKFALSRMLHQAYCQDGTPEQARALQSAHALMYGIALRLLRGDETVARDIAQQALDESWSHRLRIREPGAFTFFLIQTSVHLVQHWYRVQGRRQTESLDASDDEVDEPGQFAEALLAQASAEEEVLDRLWVDQFRSVVRECLKRYPRFIQLIEEHFFAGRSFKDLATVWERPASQLHLDKFRALQHLRDCSGLTRFLTVWKGVAAVGDA